MVLDEVRIEPDVDGLSALFADILHSFLGECDDLRITFVACPLKSGPP
jgi:hypothetical protein